MGLEGEDAISKGMQEKSKEFVASGSKIYLPAED
jgi:hypothetical protein